MAIRNEDAEAWLRPGKAGDRLSPLDTPSYLLARLSTQLSRRFNGDYADALGATTPQIRLVTFLHHVPDSTFAAIVTGSLMDKAQASRTLAALVERDLVAISGPSGPAERFTARATAALTKQGARLYERALVIAQRHQMEILAQLSPDERRSLYTILHRLVDAFDEA